MSNLTLSYIYENIMYDMIVDGSIKFHGNIEYVSQHVADGTTSTICISNNQPNILTEFVSSYINAKQTESELTIEDFYKRRTI